MILMLISQIFLLSCSRTNSIKMSLARIGLSVVRRPKILPVTCFRNTSTATTPDNKGTGEVSFAQQRLKDTLPPPFDATKPYKVSHDHLYNYSCNNHQFSVMGFE